MQSHLFIRKEKKKEGKYLRIHICTQNILHLFLIFVDLILFFLNMKRKKKSTQNKRLKIPKEEEEESKTLGCLKKRMNIAGIIYRIYK